MLAVHLHKRTSIEIRSIFGFPGEMDASGVTFYLSEHLLAIETILIIYN